MLNSNKFILFLLVFIFSISIGFADGGNQGSSSAGAWMVEQGMEAFAYSIGDSMLGINKNQSVNASTTPALIFDMITYTIDPFSFDFVTEWWGRFLILYLSIFAVMLFAGAGWIFLHTWSPQTVQTINWQLTGKYTDNFQFKNWLGTMTAGLIIPAVAYFCIQLILKINYIISALLTQQALTAVPLSPDNLMIYICMAITYFVLSIIFAIRNLIIVFFAAGGLGLAALYLIEPLKEFVKAVFLYVLLIIFMQPILIFVSAAGVMLLSAIPASLKIMFPSLYLALMLVIVGIAIVLMFGYRWISSLIWLSTRA